MSKLITKKSKFSTMDIDRVLEAAILFEQWDIMHACMKHEVSEKLLMAAITMAVDRRNWDIVETLMRQEGHRWLMSAVQMRPGKNGSTFAKLLLDNGVSPDTANIDGETPIHMAVWQIVTIRQNMAVCPNMNRDTFLMSSHKVGGWNEADWHKACDTVRLLLKYSQHAGAILSQLTEKGTTLLHQLCRYGNTDIIRDVQLQGADLLIKDTHGNSLLMSAMQSMPGDNTSALVGLLLDAGVSPDTANTDGETPIHMAVRQEDWGTVKLLLKYSHQAGAIASKVTNNGTTLLHELCKYGQIDIIQNLLSKGANTLIEDTQGNSLLTSALKFMPGKDTPQLVKLLLDAGISPDTANTGRETPIHMAVWHMVTIRQNMAVRHKWNTLTLLKSYYTVRGWVEDDWHKACDTVRLLLKYSQHAGAILSQLTEKGTTLLHQLCRYGNTDIIRDVQSQGADLLIRDTQGNSLLMSAMECMPDENVSALCRYGNTDILQDVLSQNADLLIKDTQENSLLVSAMQSMPGDNASAVLGLLLDAGVSPDVANTDGETPIHMAVWQIVTIWQNMAVCPNMNRDTFLMSSHKVGGWKEADWHKACDTVRLLLKYSQHAGAILSQLTEKGTTLLHQLCRYGNTDIIRDVQLQGADLLIKDTHGNSLLMSAVQSMPGDNTSALVGLLLDAGVSPDTANTDGETPIHMAVRQEDWGTVNLLLKYSHQAGAIASKVTNNGTTLLHELCKYGQIDIIQNLLSKGANTLIKDTQGNSLLKSALKFMPGKDTPQLVKLLLDAGISPDTANTDGETPIHMAVWQIVTIRQEIAVRRKWNTLTLLKSYHTFRGWMEDDWHKACNTVRLLLKYSQHAGAILSQLTEKGTTLLHQLCRYGNTDIIRDAQSQGADLLIRDTQGNSLLMSAMECMPDDNVSVLCRYGNTDILQDVLSQNADLLIKDTQGNSLLVSAMQSMPGGNASAVLGLLLDAGVSPDVANTDGETPIHMAVRQEDWGTVNLLLKYSHQAGAIASKVTNNGTTLLHELCKYGQIDIIQNLLSKGANTLIKDTQGNSLLKSALKFMPGKDTPQLVKLLLDAGISPDTANTDGETPIHMAVWQIVTIRQEIAVRHKWNTVTRLKSYHTFRGWMEDDWHKACNTVRLLLKYSQHAGAILSQLTEKGTTLLHQLCRYGNTDIISDVLSQGADLLIRDTQGNSLLMSAVDCMQGKNASAVVGLLLDAGISPDTANTDGETPMNMAVRQKDWATVKLLLKSCHNIGATASKVTKDGSTMMHNLCRCAQVDIMRDLLLMGANLLITDTRGNSLLMSAMECMPGKNVSALVELLLDAGVDPDTENTAGVTPIHMAVWRQQWTTLRQLLDKSYNAAALASRRTKNGTTMLHRLCEKGQTHIIQILLLRGADPLVNDIHGNSLMMKVIDRPYMIMRATNTSDTEIMVRALIKSGMSTHQAVLTKSQLQTHPNDLSHSPMWHTVKRGWLHIAKMLYASGACSQKEIHSMNLQSSLKYHEDIKRFLADIASRPRSLQELCALTVSHHLGCGPDRYQRAEGTGLPPALCHRVLHEHVLSLDFLNGTPPDPH